MSAVFMLQWSTVTGRKKKKTKQLASALGNMYLHVQMFISLKVQFQYSILFCLFGRAAPVKVNYTNIKYYTRCKCLESSVNGMCSFQFACRALL